MICSPDILQKNLKTILPTLDDNLPEQEYTRQVLDLVEEHYGVRVPEADVIALHPLKNKGSADLKIWNRKLGSAYQKLTKAIKRGGKAKAQRDQEAERNENEHEKGEKEKGEKEKEKKKVNFFLTFQTTYRRSALIQKCKSLKKAGRIEKFSSNENGQISVTLNGGEFVKITVDPYDKSTKTFTEDELEALCSK